jgi:hypothetical protein
VGEKVWGQETWAILVTGGVAAIAAAAIAWFIRKRDSETEDVTLGFLGPSFAAMYLLVLALSLATEWQAISSAQQAVGSEAVAVRQVGLAANGLPAPAARDLTTEVRGYLSTVIHHDWPQMQGGTLDDRSGELLASMTSSVLRVNPSTSGASDAQQYALGELNALASARAERAGAVGTCLPTGVLIAVIVTSIIVIVFPFVGGIRPTRTSFAVAVVQTSLIAVAALVVIQLDNPFAGPLATNPNPLTAVAALVGAR